VATFEPKDWLTPRSIEETTKMLKQFTGKCRIIAGGTTFHELVQRGLMPEVDVIVDISQLGLNYVKDEGDSIRIGATSTVSELSEAAVFQEAGLAALGDALQTIEPVQVRNVATIGGSICASVSFFDLPTAVVCLNGRVRIVGVSGERQAKVQDFLLDYFLPDLKRDEFVTELIIPKPKNGSGSAYSRVCRTAFDFAVVSVGASITIKDGRCEDATIAVGALGRVIRRAAKMEKELLGKKLSSEVLNGALKKLDELKATATIHAGVEYKRRILPLVTLDAVRRAEERALGGRAN